jgi:serine/threonine protein kinase
MRDFLPQLCHVAAHGAAQHSAGGYALLMHIATVSASTQRPPLLFSVCICLQRAVQHEGVVKVLAVCFDPLAIVTELCECSLSERVTHQWAEQQAQQQQQSQQQELSWALVVDLLGQAADALAHIHAPNPTIIHNDLRAANILLAAAPQGSPSPWQLKICDFGLAVQVAAGASATEARIPRVTDQRWVAPEVQAGWEQGQGFPVTPAADVYALGECGVQ